MCRDVVIYFEYPNGTVRRRLVKVQISVVKMWQKGKKFFKTGHVVRGIFIQPELP